MNNNNSNSLSKHPPASELLPQLNFLIVEIGASRLFCETYYKFYSIIRPFGSDQRYQYTQFINKKALVMTDDVSPKYFDQKPAIWEQGRGIINHAF